MRAVIAVLGLFLMIQAATAEEVELVSGERLTGRVAARSAETIRLDHPILGMLEIPASAVRTIDGKPLRVAEPPTEPTPPPAEQKPAMPAEEAPPEEPKPVWESTFELGANGRYATVEDLNLRVAFLTTRTVPGNELRFDATYRYATSRGDRSQNNLTSGTFSEWKAERSPLSAFGQGRFDYAEFQSWDERFTVGGGLGYRLFDIKDVNEKGQRIDRFKLTTRLGGGLRWEFGSDAEELSPEGLLGGEFAYRLNGQMMLNGASTLYPDLNEWGEMRVVSRLDWTLDLDKLDGISLHLGLAHEYISQTAQDVGPHDLSAFAALVVKF